MERRKRIRTAAALGAVSLVLGLQAGEPWQEKPPAEWSREEAQQVLNDSPWAQEVRLLQPSGRILAVLANGRKIVYQESRSTAPRIFAQEPMRRTPELVEGVYGVRWSSAGIVQQAAGRLQELSPVLAEMEAETTDLDEGHIVLTCRVVQPPAEPTVDSLSWATYMDQDGRLRRDTPPQVSDIFAGLSAEQLQAAAELRTSEKLRVKPDRVVRHGLGASEGISFYFPRQADGKEMLPPGTEWAEFVFSSAENPDLKAKFKLDKMQVDGRADY